MIGDMLYDVRTRPSLEMRALNPENTSHTLSSEYKYKDLLQPVLRDGQRVCSSPSLREIQEFSRKERQLLPANLKELQVSTSYLVGLETEVFNQKQRLLQKVI